jgi:hypothetical protein
LTRHCEGYESIILSSSIPGANKTSEKGEFRNKPTERDLPSMRGNRPGRDRSLTSGSIHDKLGEVNALRVRPITSGTEDGTVLEESEIKSCARKVLAVAKRKYFPDHSFYIWSMDTTEKLQLCTNGEQYIIIPVEHFSKYTVTAPPKDLRLKSVMEFIIKEIISLFGNMDLLLSDNASCFTSKTFNEMAKVLGFKIIHSSPRNPHKMD